MVQLDKNANDFESFIREKRTKINEIIQQAVQNILNEEKKQRAKILLNEFFQSLTKQFKNCFRKIKKVDQLLQNSESLDLKCIYCQELHKKYYQNNKSSQLKSDITTKLQNHIHTKIQNISLQRQIQEISKNTKNIQLTGLRQDISGLIQLIQKKASQKYEISKKIKKCELIWDKYTESQQKFSKGTNEEMKHQNKIQQKPIQNDMKKKPAPYINQVDYFQYDPEPSSYSRIKSQSKQSIVKKKQFCVDMTKKQQKVQKQSVCTNEEFYEDCKFDDSIVQIFNQYCQNK